MLLYQLLNFFLLRFFLDNPFSHYPFSGFGFFALLINVSFWLVTSTLSTNSSDSVERAVRCYRIDNTTWRLIWEEQFSDQQDSDHHHPRSLSSSINSSAQFDRNWIAQNELKNCNGNDLRPVTNCNLARNIFRSNGFLALIAKREPYLGLNYTGAAITTAQYFGYGRFEIRAMQPVGSKIRTRIITRNMTEAKLHQNGQINIASNTMDNVLYRDVISAQHYESVDIPMSDLEQYWNTPEQEAAIEASDFDFETQQKFHTYGAEWTAEGVTFFVDQHRSPLTLFNETVGLRAPHQLQLQIGVGGRDYDRPIGLDRDLDDLRWECPAFIIDFVRFYEPLIEDDDDDEDHISIADCIIADAQPPQPPTDQQVIERICARALRDQTISFAMRIAKHWKTIASIAAILTLFICVCVLVSFAAWMRRKIVANKRDPFAVLNSTMRQKADPADDTYDQPVYDDPTDGEHAFRHSTRSTSYLKMEDIGRDNRKNDESDDRSYYMVMGSRSMNDVRPADRDYDSANYYPIWQTATKVDYYHLNSFVGKRVKSDSCIGRRDAATEAESKSKRKSNPYMSIKKKKYDRQPKNVC